jgi:hypothetical protein
MSFARQFKATILWGAIIGLLIGGYVSYTFVFNDAAAQEGRTIPVQVQRSLPDSTILDSGDSCSFSSDILRFPLTNSQIVITDENEVIVAIHGVVGNVDRSSSGSLFCTAELDIPVPEASFYTVHLGDERIVGFSESEFPVDPINEVWIIFDFD